MTDEIFDRQYRAGRDALHAGIDRFARRSAEAVKKTFATIHRVRFGAPWTSRNGAGC